MMILRRYKEWISQMPASDDANDFVAERGLFVPFSDQLFAGRGAAVDEFRADSTASTTSNDADLLPTVCSTASVKWTGRAGDKVGDVTARVVEDTGLPAEDARPSAASRAAQRKLKRRQQVMEAASTVKTGTKCFVNLLAWDEYKDEYPYPSPVESNFCRGNLRRDS